MARRLVLLDFGLIDRSGHACEYDGNVTEAFLGRGWECVVYAHRACRLPTVGRVQVRPWFPYAPTDPIVGFKPLRPIAKSLFHVARTGAELERAVAAADGPETVFFVPHAEQYQIPPLYHALRKRQGTLVLMLRATSLRLTSGGPRPTFRTWLYRLFLPRLARLGARLVLVTDSEHLRREYAGITAHPVHVLPIPNPPTVRKARRRDPGPLKIVSVGRASFEKGIQFLPGIMREVRRAGVASVFSIHVYSHASEDPTAYEPVRAAIRAEMAEGDHLIEAPLASAQYRRELELADVALLLFEPNRYRHQTSGVLIDVLAAGGFPVVSEGTWLADMVREAGHGAVVPIDGSTDVAEAVAAILKAGPPDTISPGVARLLAFHSRDSFFELFTRAIDAGPSAPAL